MLLFWGTISRFCTDVDLAVTSEFIKLLLGFIRKRNEAPSKCNRVLTFCHLIGQVGSCMDKMCPMCDRRALDPYNVHTWLVQSCVVLNLRF